MAEKKSGVEKTQALELIDQVSALQNITVKGLMTMAALTTDEKAVREAFAGLRNLSAEAKKLLDKKGRGEMKYLSMGMSQDFPIAIEEGSNMVRVGRAIFGDS